MAEPKPVVPHTSFKSTLLGWLAGQLLRVLGWTLRMELRDHSGAGKPGGPGPVIWVFWHNQVVAAPLMARKFLRYRRVFVLTSASRDGAILAKVVACFGLGAVRGSSSKRGARALVELKRLLQSGKDVAFTPDGPRGPSYQMAGGPIKLASLTGAALQPLMIHYQKAWRLKSWDRTFIPKPFSKVIITCLPLEKLDPDLTEEQFETERKRIETLILPEEANR